MEKGTKIRVVYSDGLFKEGKEVTRSKDMIFKGKEGNLFVFVNFISGRVEYINEERIIRMEGERNANSWDTN